MFPRSAITGEFISPTGITDVHALKHIYKVVVGAVKISAKKGALFTARAVPDGNLLL